MRCNFRIGPIGGIVSFDCFVNRWDLRLAPQLCWVFEWPQGSPMWRLEMVQSFLAAHAHHAAIYSSCTNMTCPSGVLRRLVSNDRALKLQVSSTCARTHEHSSSSQFQPLQADGFLRAVFHALLAQGPSQALPACSAPVRLRCTFSEMQWCVAGTPRPLPPPLGAAAAAASPSRGPRPPGNTPAWSTEALVGLLPAENPPAGFPSHVPPQRGG